MKKSLLWIAPFALLLLAAVLAPAVPATAGDDTPAAQPAAASADCAQETALAPAAGVESVALAELFAPAPLPAAPQPCPVVRCLYSPCTTNAECTAMPGGTCNLYCTKPKQGCCTYP